MLLTWMHQDRGRLARARRLYRQSRVGSRRAHFKVLKFRSMRLDAELTGAQWAQRKDPRVNARGRDHQKAAGR